MREIEREVLLASSGELGFWRRLRLTRRLRRDPEARRLAETLCAGALLLGPAPRRSSRPVPVGWLAAAAVVAAACGLGLVLRGALNGRPAVAPTIEPAAGSAPLYQTTGRLLVAGLPPLAGAEAPAAGLDAPPLPPWSARLEEGVVWDFMLERSQ